MVIFKLTMLPLLSGPMHSVYQVGSGIPMSMCHVLEAVASGVASIPKLGSVSDRHVSELSVEKGNIDCTWKRQL